MGSVITAQDREKYVLKTERDVRILQMCKDLEEQELSDQDKHLVQLIKDQLIDDWRKPLEVELEGLANKYL